MQYQYFFNCNGVNYIVICRLFAGSIHTSG